MSLKTIKKIIPARKVNMGGHLLDQPLPSLEAEYIDPFLLIHHWKNIAPGGERQQEVGVGPHPHRGFSPVTFIYKGDIQHRDSLGNNAIVDEGGTQWMFAGKGITHSERPSKKLAEEGGELEFIQFWVNAPSENKMEAAFYKPIFAAETPTIENDNYSIQVVCGEYEGVKGSVEYYSPLVLLRGHIKSSAELRINLDPTFNTILYQLDGSLSVNGKDTEKKEMVWFNQDGAEIEIIAKENTRFIVLAGEPINEPMKSYGPFVMNTQTEIMEAIKDSQIGKMGVLIEEFE